MAATLNVRFTDPSDVVTQAGVVQAVVQAAFADWVRHFDYTTGTYTLNVSFRAPSQPADASLRFPSPAAFEGISVTTNNVVVSQNGLYAERLGLALTGRGAGPADPGTLHLNPGYLNGTLSLANAVAPIERELGHQFGIQSLNLNYRTSYPGGSAVQIRIRTSVYDRNIRIVRYTPDFTIAFNGPNAVTAYGGPVPLLPADPGTTIVGGQRAVTTNTDGAASVQPLDVALLRDAGVAALTDQELGEHRVARLYLAAFGRTADSAGLIAQYAGLRNGQTLAQLGDGFVTSAEFTNRYGMLSDAGFVDALYQNVLGRAGDAAGVAFFQGALARGASRGTILAAFADSDEERGRLNGDPNVTYAATVEGQVARAYDTAFGRDVDPAGFTLLTSAIINGASLQQVAMTFLGSAEFASRYGAAPTDQQLVDALYQNTLRRAPEAAGEAQYVRALASGSYSRADLFADFSNSAEHIGLLAQRTAARDAAGYNTDLLPHLGIIPVITGPLTA